MDCKKSEDVFAKMSEFSGKSTDYINHLKGIWGVENGFENFLYNYRISIRLIENLALPENCKTLKTTTSLLINMGPTIFSLLLKREKYIDAVIGPQSYHDINNIILKI